MNLRFAKLDDAEGLAVVHVAAWRSAYHDILPADVIEGMAQRCHGRWIENLQNNPDRRNLLCEVHGRTVGFACFGPTRDQDADCEITAELYALYVAPEYWNQGYGRALWLTALDHARKGEWRDITVWTLEENARARRFYERAGFRLEIMRKLVRLGDQPFPEVRYRRLIDRAPKA